MNVSTIDSIGRIVLHSSVTYERNGAKAISHMHRYDKYFANLLKNHQKKVDDIVYFFEKFQMKGRHLNKKRILPSTFSRDFQETSLK